MRYNQKIIADDHDTECSMRAGELIQLGFLGNEFAYYGVAYQKEDKGCYYICEKEKRMLEFIESCLKNDIFPSWICYHNKRYQIPIGEYDNLHQKTKKDLALHLKKQYSSDFHKAIFECKQSSARNSGTAILQHFAKEINSCFDEGLIQIYKGLTKDAFLMCKTDINYFNDALGFARREISKINKSNEEFGHLYRTYYGFAMYDNEKIKFYSNATELTVYEKRQQMIAKGIVVSPILSKQYAGNDIFDLNQKKIDFEKNYLASYFTPSFMKDLNLFWKMKSGVDKKCYTEWKNKLMHESQISLQVFMYYGMLWGVESV